MSKENEYVDVIKQCFQGYDDNYLNAAFDAAEEIQGELKGNFREAVKKHLEDKGYSKGTVDDFMEMYLAVFAIAFSAGVAAYHLANE